MRETIKNLIVTGYRSYELGVFQEKDPKIQVIKNLLKKEMTAYIENGLEWLLFSGNLGVEVWGMEVAKELKNEYPQLQTALMLPFEGFGENWNEQNQLKLSEMKQQADFVEAVSHQPYHTPAQLKNHTRFLLEHTDGALVIYDDEAEGKPYWFLQEAKVYQKSHWYEINQITFEDLQNSVEFYE